MQLSTFIYDLLSHLNSQEKINIVTDQWTSLSTMVLKYQYPPGLLSDDFHWEVDWLSYRNLNAPTLQWKTLCSQTNDEKCHWSPIYRDMQKRRYRFHSETSGNTNRLFLPSAETPIRLKSIFAKASSKRQGQSLEIVELVERCIFHMNNSMLVTPGLSIQTTYLCSRRITSTAKQLYKIIPLLQFWYLRYTVAVSN